MAEDDVGRIREAFALLNSDTYEQVLPLVADDFVMVTTADVASEPDVYRGPAGVIRWWESFLDVMDEVRLEANEFHDAGRSQAIVEFVIHVRGQASGIEASQPAIGLARVRDGQLVRLEFFTDLDSARAAAAAAS